MSTETPLSADLNKLDAHLGRLPVFPLPSAVLLPFELLPLHIFEPRYREMIADVVEHERPLIIAQLSPGWEGDYEGRPPVESLCGVGIVTHHERLSDGRSNILVKGLARIRIESELPSSRSFREVRARLVDDVSSALPAKILADRMESLRQTMFALCAARPGPAASMAVQLASRATAAGVLADVVAAAMLTEFEPRKKILEALDVGERLQLVQRAVAELLIDASPQRETQYRN